MAKFDPFLSLDCAGMQGMGAIQVMDRIKFCNVAIVQKPEGPNTYDLKIWLLPSGNHGSNDLSDVTLTAPDR